MEWNFQIIKGLAWPIEVRQAWQELTDKDPAASYAQTCYWNQACIEQLGFQPDSVILVVVRRGTNVEAVFPLTIEKRRVLGFRIRVLCLPRHLHIDLHDIALGPTGSDKDLIAELFNYLRTQREYACDVIDLGMLTERSALYRLLSGEAGVRCTVIPRRVCNYLPIMSEGQLNNHVSKNMRGSLRKANNKLRQFASVKFLATRDPRVLPEYFERFLAVEASGWKGEKGTGTAIILDKQLTAFYRQLLQSFGREGRCELDLLEIDGRVAAAQFALIIGASMYILKIGYDQDLAAAAPGNLLLAQTLFRLHMQGEITEINLVTNAKWHSRWRPKQQRVYEARCYGNSLVGLIAFLQVRIRGELSKLRSLIKSKAASADV